MNWPETCEARFHLVNSRDRGRQAGSRSEVFLNELLRHLEDLQPEDCQLLRDRVQLEVVEAGGVDIELTFNDLQENQILSREMWISNRPVQEDDSIWHFCYSVSRGGHLQASLVASGSSQIDAPQQQLAGYLGVLQALCLYWPVTAGTLVSSKGQSHLELLPFDPEKPDTKKAAA